jgi:hypothetical protein
MKSKKISQVINVFHGRLTPESGTLVGYGATIESFNLNVPMPNKLALISKKHKQYSTDEWLVFTPRHQPKETLYDHLVFALKYEGVNLLVLKNLFEKLKPSEIENWIEKEPQSQYRRRIWFLYEWLMQKELSLPDSKGGNYISLIDEKLQYASSISKNSRRHRIKNNLPGVVDFCPLIHKTIKLEKYIENNLSNKTNNLISGIKKDILSRTSAFLLLKDSRASFIIEGEKLIHNRTVRWGKAIGQAGMKRLSKDELYRLQQIIIENSRFIEMGYRIKGGFIGEHDRVTGEPIPDHISARWQDLDKLMSGLINATKKMEEEMFNPVLTAAMIAFGFVFIHPFEDGNGRIHRYLIHHLLASTKFTPQGIIFPVSAAILEHIDDYREVLESYSQPLNDFIKWKKTPDNNVEVLNKTIDFYRYFDATKHVEFLFECIDYTINNIIPEEVIYLQNHDEFKYWIDDKYQMSNSMIDLLIRFLMQNKGSLSKRAREKEFSKLTENEVKEIEKKYKEIFENNPDIKKFNPGVIQT